MKRIYLSGPMTNMLDLNSRCSIRRPPPCAPPGTA